jgi:hypothetical protein
LTDSRAASVTRLPEYDVFVFDTARHEESGRSAAAARRIDGFGLVMGVVKREESPGRL